MARYKQAGVGLGRLQKLMPGAADDELVKRGPVYERGDFPPIPVIRKAQADHLNTFEVRGLSYHYPVEGAAATGDGGRKTGDGFPSSVLWGGDGRSTTDDRLLHVHSLRRMAI